MTGEGDIVDDFVQVLLKAGVSPEEASRHEEYFRLRYGGDESYVAKTPSVTHKKKQQALQAVKSGAKPSEAASRHGISRDALYRLLKKTT